MLKSHSVPQGAACLLKLQLVQLRERDTPLRDLSINKTPMTPSTFTRGNLEDTAKHVERQSQEMNVFTRQINTSTRKGEQNTQGFLTHLQVVCCFKQGLGIEMKQKEEVEEHKQYNCYV